jgi:hypothetical protein
MGLPFTMRSRNNNSCSTWVQSSGVVEDIRSVSIKMKPLRDCATGEWETAFLYSLTECWQLRGLSGVHQARVERWVEGKRWMWESTIGNGGILAQWGGHACPGDGRNGDERKLI